VQIFIQQLTLFARLCSGRNKTWKDLISATFPVEYLVSAIWKPECEKFRDILFDLFFNLYIDQPPLEETKLPILIRFLGDLDFQSVTFEGRIRRELNLDKSYPRTVLRELIGKLVEDLTLRVQNFVNYVGETVDGKLIECKFRKEVKVEDLPQSILESVSLLLKLFRMNVLEVFELQDHYSHILTICLQNFDFTQMNPAQFIFLIEQQKKDSRTIKAPKQSKKKRKGGIAGKTGIEEESIRNSLLNMNYFLLKNQISNRLTNSLSYSSNNDIQARKLSVDVFYRFMDLRQQFLLDNFTEWVRIISSKFAGKNFNEEDDKRLFSQCSNEVWTVFPQAFKTSINKADLTQEKLNFVKYLKDKSEIFDLPHLIKNVPSNTSQKSLKKSEDLLPSLLIAIMTTNEEALSLQLMDLLLKMYSQRKLLAENLKNSFYLCSETNLEIYKQAQVYNKGITKMIERIDFWSRNETMLFEATEMIGFLNEITEKLQQKEELQTPTIHRRTDDKCQEIFYQANCHVMIIKLYKKIISTFNLMQEQNQLTQKESLSLMLGMMQRCIDILRLFVKDNLPMKRHLTKYLDELMEFTRYNIGQTDLIADLFTDNPVVQFDEKRKIIRYYVDKILAEGNQVRFLNFFDSILDSRREDHMTTVSLVLDTFLPYTLPGEQDGSYKLIYGYLNRNTGEPEMYLNDDVEAFREDIGQNIIAFKCEPFLFHRQLLKTYLKLLDSSLENLVKMRLRKYFSLNYLVRFLSDYDEFFEPGFEQAVAGKAVGESIFTIGTDKDHRHRIGTTLLKPVVAELLFRVHCEGEANLYRAIVPSLNTVTNLISRESERLQALDGLFSAEFNEYLGFLVKALVKMFEMKTNSPFDPTEYDQFEFRLLIEMVLANHSLITGQFTSHEIDKLEKTVEWFEDAQITEAYEKAKEDLKKAEEVWNGALTNLALEQKASTIKIEMFTLEDVWQVALDSVKNQLTDAIQDECDVLALALHGFDTLFDKDLKEKYGVGFKVNEFLLKVRHYLSNEVVPLKQKCICIDLLIRFIDTADDREACQVLLDRNGFSKTMAGLLAESKFEDEEFSRKLVDFLISLLKPGNRIIQKSLYSFFSSNSVLTNQLFKHIAQFIHLFQKIVSEQHFIKGVKYDGKLALVERLIELLRLMCENHFEDMQEYLRSQPNLRKRVNFLETVCTLMKQCSGSPIHKVYPLFLTAINFLVEMLQGPCVANQASLIDLNVISTLDKILLWRKNPADYLEKMTTSMTITQKSRLLRLKLAKRLEDAGEFNIAKIQESLQGQIRMDDGMIASLKYKAIVLVNSMLEMLADRSSLAKIKKEVSYQTLKRVLIEVYVDFLERYEGNYVIESLNHFDSHFMESLKSKDLEKAQGFILETGFLTLFIIMKLYNKKTEINEDIKNDLMKIRDRMKYYQKLGYTNKSLVESYKKDESEILELDKSHSSVNPIDFFTKKAASIFEEAINFFFFYSSKIEIFRDEKIQEIYFIKLPYSEYLDDADKDKFNHEVDRSTTLNKVKGLIEEVDYFTVIMKFAYYLKTINFIVRILFNYQGFYTALSFFTAVSINILIMASYSTSDQLDFDSNLYDASLGNTLDNDTTMIVIRAVGYFQLFIGVRFLIFYIMKKIFMSLNSTEYKDMYYELDGFKLFKFRFSYFVLDKNIIYYAVYTTMAMLGIFVHSFFFAFHLYEVMNQFKTCRIFIQSIIQPYKQLILAFIFYNILIYEYAVLGYFFFWRWFVDATADDAFAVGHYCDSLYMCYITVFDETNKEPGGVGSYLDFFDEDGFKKKLLPHHI
jgi:hypothetical protein